MKSPRTPIVRAGKLRVILASRLWSLVIVA
jgi:hypothetical protein